MSKVLCIAKRQRLSLLVWVCLQYASVVSGAGTAHDSAYVTTMVCAVHSLVNVTARLAIPEVLVTNVSSKLYILNLFFGRGKKLLHLLIDYAKQTKKSGTKMNRNWPA